MISYPPIFKDLVENSITFEIDPSIRNFSFVIPDYNDYETEKEEINLEIAGIDDEFMTYDEDTKEILFFGLTDKHLGNHNITVTLTDSDGRQTSETFEFSITGSIQEQEDEGEDKEEQDDQTDEEEVTIEETSENVYNTSRVVKVIDTKIDSTGLVVIQFNTPMKTDFDYNLINTTNVDIFVEPANDRHLDDEFFDPN